MTERERYLLRVIAKGIAQNMAEQRKEIDAELSRLRGEIEELRQRLETDTDALADELREGIAERQAQPMRPVLTVVS